MELLYTGAKIPMVRAGVCLQAHVGLPPGKVLALRVEDVDVTRDIGRVRARLPDRDGKRVTLSYSLPPVACRALSAWVSKRRRQGGPKALLFPKRGDPKRPTSSINRAIAREAARLKVAAPTMQQIRRLSQVALRELRASRAQVRGSARGPKARRAPTRTATLTQQRDGWAFQQGAAAQPLPLRAPARCRANQPERGRRRDRHKAPEEHPEAPLTRGRLPPERPVVRPWEPPWEPPPLPPLPPLSPEEEAVCGKYYYPATTDLPGDQAEDLALVRQEAVREAAAPPSRQRPAMGGDGLTGLGVAATFVAGVFVGAAFKEQIEGGVARVVEGLRGPFGRGS